MSTNARGAFIAGLSLCYFVAFGSSFIQYPGLFSEHYGIAPIKKPILGIPSDESMLALHLVGMGVSLLIGTGVFLSPNLMLFLPFLYWVLIRQARSSGAPFFNFQWDSLLVEVGVVGSFSVLQTAHGERPARSTVVALAFLAFKLMFSSGVVKITSDDTRWIQFRALDFHFASQPLPTPLAWFAHQLPAWVLWFGTASSLWIEICASILLLAPGSGPRAIAAIMMIALMVNIALTGNYNFFNLLTAVLMLPLMDDAMRAWYKSKRLVTLWDIPALAALGAITTTVFKFDMTNPQRPVSIISARDMNELMDLVVPLAFFWTILLAFAAIGKDLKESWQEGGRTFHVRAALGVISLFLVVLCGVPMIYSLMNDRELVDVILPAPVMNVFFAVGEHFSAPYGLFRTMTGVGKDGKQVRVPALLLELMDSSSDTMTPVQFRYYLSGEASVPAFVQPHQPRLDWQMWFAALTDPKRLQTETWLWSLCDKLLEGDRAVWALLSPSMAAISDKASSFSGLKLLKAEFDFTKDWSSPNYWRLVDGGKPQVLLQIARRRSPAPKIPESWLMSMWIDHGRLLPITMFVMALSMRRLAQSSRSSKRH